MSNAWILACTVSALSLSACSAGAPGTALGSAGEPGTEAAADTSAGLPAGFGTLRQDELTIALRDGPLLIKATPLAEPIIRLLAPDSYRRLHALAESRRTGAGGAGEADAARPASELFIISFFSYEPNVAFQPEALRIVFQGRQIQAASIQPVSGGFGRQQLAQQETQSAIYAFDTRLDYDQPIIVRYGTLESNDWLQILPKLEIERARVRARAGGT